MRWHRFARGLFLLILGTGMENAQASRTIPTPEEGRTLLFDGGSSDLRDVTREFFDTCEDTLRVVMYKFTDEKIARSLKAVLRRGVRVQMVLDRIAAVEEGDRPWIPLVRRGLDLRLWPGGDRELHAKFAIAQGAGVLVGSANWTPSGLGRNLEVMLWTRDGDLASSFNRIFREIWRSAEPLSVEEGK